MSHIPLRTGTCFVNQFRKSFESLFCFTRLASDHILFAPHHPFPLAAEPEAGDLCSLLLTAFSLVLVLVTLPFSLCVSVKVSQWAEFNLIQNSQGIYGTPRNIWDIQVLGIRLMGN